MVKHPMLLGLIPIYEAVKRTGLQNAMSARVHIPSNLNIKAWEYYLGLLGDRQQVMDFVKFGFPTGYVGPISDTQDVPNHPSAADYPSHVDDFIEHEIGLKGLVGPFDDPPFAPWCHVSPLMSEGRLG